MKEEPQASRDSEVLVKRAARSELGDAPLTSSTIDGKSWTSLSRLFEAPTAYASYSIGLSVSTRLRLTEFIRDSDIDIDL